MSCTTPQGGKRAQVLRAISGQGTTLTTATTAIPTELGTYVPTAWYHCVPSAGTKDYDAHATRPDGWFRMMSRSM